MDDIKCTMIFEIPDVGLLECRHYHVIKLRRPRKDSRLQVIGIEHYRGARDDVRDE